MGLVGPVEGRLLTLGRLLTSADWIPVTSSCRLHHLGRQGFVRL